mgnify:CR=1 FL=1
MGENGVYDTNPETGAQILGDVVISMEKARDQAELFGHSLQREVGYLTAHSVCTFSDMITWKSLKG